MTQTIDPPKTGPELIDEMIKEPNMDRVFDLDPKLITAEDYLELVRGLRLKRSQFIEAASKKDAKKSGVVEDEDDDDDE